MEDFSPKCTIFKLACLNEHDFCSYSSEGSEGLLKGPLCEETEASDSVDGGYDSVVLDPERLEPRLDEEDTYVVILPRKLELCVCACVYVWVPLYVCGYICDCVWLVCLGVSEYVSHAYICLCHCVVTECHCVWPQLRLLFQVTSG